MFMEGPSLVILKEQAQKFVGKNVTTAYGSQKINFERLVGQRITDLKSWGKHFLIVFEDCTVRIHYLMFGNFYLDAKHPEKSPKLAMEFANGEWNNYNCAAKILEGTDMDALYDWSTDVMQESWDSEKAKKKLKAKPDMLVCDALLDQSIFSGVGNIIKNEVFYRIQMHPESQLGALPARKLQKLVEEARTYSFDFYNWKKEGTLRKHWLAHTKKECQRCQIPLIKKHTGATPRRSFFCTQCQPLYTK
jgi:endonuclease-8